MRLLGCSGVGPRALSNGINSAVFFCFFEALRGVFKRRQAEVPPRQPCCHVAHSSASACLIKLLCLSQRSCAVLAVQCLATATCSLQPCLGSP